MDPDTTKLKLALHVLATIAVDKKVPTAEEKEALVRCAETPEEAELPLAQLANLVIARERRRNSNLGCKGAGS